jgi:hypothetical protein
MSTIAISVDLSVHPGCAVTKVSRIVDALNYGAAYEHESLYPVNEAVIDWYQALGPHWDEDPQPRFSELKKLIESIPTETGTLLVVIEPEPGKLRIIEA